MAANGVISPAGVFGVGRFDPRFLGYPNFMYEKNTEPSESEKPYDPATDPDADPENLTSTTHQPNQAEGADEEIKNER